MASGAPRRVSLVERASSVPDVVYVSDVRLDTAKDASLTLNDQTTFDQFKNKITELFDLKEDDKYVITTTYREKITEENLGLLEPGDTLYILNTIDQELKTQTKEKVNYLPHYDTIVKGGMYEYYASEGQNPLPYAFAELIDNALAATADNIGERNIEIRLHLDEDKIFVIDNGKGMTSRQLNNWAVYRLSKFIRQDRPTKLGQDVDTPSSDPLGFQAPRSLNSDISYFGVGGKQAIFFIGTATTMVTKVRGFPDVHELSISRDQFEKKEINKEEIYSGYIRNRKLGDDSHIPSDEDTLRSLVGEEVGRDSFTAVCIQGINPVHIPYLKGKVKDWTRQLAHIYHYYIHGPNGNTRGDGSRDNSFNSAELLPDDWFTKINMKVKLYTKSTKEPVVYDLRTILDDMQTLYIQSAAAMFEFKATVEGTGVAEGVLRYHPFLYDRETYPADYNDHRVEDDTEEDHGYAAPDTRAGRRRRPMFECYWNGRLIPYTLIDDFEWCTVSKKPKGPPAECYNRVSGVIWTNDKFQVSTNKLTFIDLEVKLRDKQSVFTRILGKNEKRTDIAKEFSSWLRECHENLDKQIKFFAFQGKKTRPELPKSRQSPWGVFSKIEWDGKLYQEGTLVRMHRTLPILYGSIKQIWLYGDYDGDVYATGGELEVHQEPRTLYDDVKFISLSKLDRAATDATVKKYIEEEERKLPKELVVSWPSGDLVKHGEKRPAGRTIGDIKVEIHNCKGESINRLPGSQQRKLLVELKVLRQTSSGDQVLNHHISQHGKNWGYWFRKMENINTLGTYTLQLQCVLNESGVNSFANRPLPSHKITFTVTEAEPVKFTIGMLEGPFKIGSPFNIPLEFQDNFGNQTKPSTKYSPVLEASDLVLKYEEVTTKASSLLISNVTVEGDLGKNALQGKSFNVMVKLPEFNDYSQTVKLRMLAEKYQKISFHTTRPAASLLVTPASLQIETMPPASLHVTPASLQIENGDNVSLMVEVRDTSGNTTATARASATVKFSGAVGTPTYSVDCSKTGVGTLAGKQVLLKKLRETQTIQARVELSSFRSVPAVEIPVTVEPSSRAANIKVTYEKDGETIAIADGEDLIGLAGDPVKGIKFSLMDEAGRPKVVDSAFVSKIKVNWTPKLSADSVCKGKLPDLKLPTSVTESKYCHVSLLDGSGLDFSFTVKAVAGPAAVLKCSCSGSNRVRLGEKLAGDLEAVVTDKYGNHKKLERSSLKDLGVTGEGLVEDELVRGFGQTSGFNIQNISFSSGELGHREVCVEWEGLKDFVRFEVVAGPPDKLTILNWDPTQPVTIYNNGKTPQPLIAQLCDVEGNPTMEEGVKIQLTRDVGVRLTPTPQPLKTDKKGQTNFGYFIVYGKSGIYEIQPKAFIGRNIISGPKIQVSIQLDPTKPVRLEVTEVGKVKVTDKVKVAAGEVLPDLTVSVLAEDDSVMTSAKQSCMRMKITYTDNRPAYSIQPPDKDRPAHSGTFSFSARKSPEESGIYNVVFSYVDGVKFSLQSEPISVQVDPGPVESLAPSDDPGTPTVSNTKSATSRTLLRKLQLQLRDRFGNSVSSASNGRVAVEIVPPASAATAEIPALIGHTQRLQVPLTKGTASVTNLMIEENTPGKDGQEYILRCTLEGLSAAARIPPYELSFLFYNDVKKQSQMAALSKERDNLMGVIRTYRSLFDTTQQLISELKLSVKEAVAEEQKLKAELRKLGRVASQLDSMTDVQNSLTQANQERDRLKVAPRRTCGLQPTPKDPAVLGKIAHLAEVEEDECARVLSWHMSADMDCVVTLSTKKAQDIHHRTQGKQQVLPLDSIYRKNLPDWSKPLPHVRLRPNWKPPGKPVYARDLLNFPSDADKCQIVFGMLLGDTVILDTLEDANVYRQEIVKFTHCPTILTRDGDRIRSNGKFGGLMNKALPFEKLRGAVFGAPISKQYYNVSRQIDVLQNFQQAMQKRSAAESELAEQSKIQNTPEMVAKHKECSEAEEQLRALETRLGFTSPSTANSSSNLLDHGHSDPRTNRNHQRSNSKPATPKSSRARNTPSGDSNPKKSRVSDLSNGHPKTSSPGRRRSSAEDSTPTGSGTRTSMRRAAAESNQAWESLRKRPRRN